MRITYDAAADAVYVYLTGEPLTPGRTTIQAGAPPGIDGFIALDWKDGRLIGLHIRVFGAVALAAPEAAGRSHVRLHG